MVTTPIKELFSANEIASMDNCSPATIYNRLKQRPHDLPQRMSVLGKTYFYVPGGDYFAWRREHAAKAIAIATQAAHAS